MTNEQHIHSMLPTDEASIFTSLPVDEEMPSEGGRFDPWARAAYGPQRRSRSQGAEPSRMPDNSWQEWQDYIRLRGVRPVSASPWYAVPERRQQQPSPNTTVSQAGGESQVGEANLPRVEAGDEIASSHENSPRTAPADATPAARAPGWTTPLAQPNFSYTGMVSPEAISYPGPVPDVPLHERFA